MRKSSTHFPLLLALTLATGCSPIAHINFPDGSAAETPDAIASSGTMTVNQQISLTLIPAPPPTMPGEPPLTGMTGQHGPVPSNLPGNPQTIGIIAGSPGGPCPTELMGAAVVNFSYRDKCSKGSSIHHVICRYPFDAKRNGLSGNKTVHSLRYHENGNWPYVIHSQVGQFNALQAVGTVRVIYRKPGQNGAVLESKLISSSKQDPAVLVSGMISESAEKLERDTVLSFPAGLTAADIMEIQISAAVHCSVRRDTEVANEVNVTKCPASGGSCNEVCKAPIYVANGADLLKMDNIAPLDWKLGGFSLDVSIN